MTGYRDYLVERTKAVLETARVSPAARARIKGERHHRPPAKTHTIVVNCAKPSERQISDGAPVAAVTGPVAATCVIASPAETVLRAPDIAAVQAAFCEAYNEAGGRAEDGGPFTVEHLRSPRRGAVLAGPRHVCIALVRRICVDCSLPTIGRAFKRDHTTAVHAIKRAQTLIVEDAVLAAAHAKVLALFEAKQ